MSSVRQSRCVRSGHGILTAVLVGSTVFSAMTLPLVMQQPVPVLMDFPPQWSQTPPSRMDRETRNSVIRYLGIAIVASVGSGIGAVELLRRRYQACLLRQQSEFGLQEAVVLPDRDLEAAYMPLVPASIESSTFYEEPAQVTMNPAASEEMVVSQSAATSTATDYPTEVAPSGLILEG